MLKYLSVLCLALPLQGCFFVFIPGSVIDSTADAISGAKGQNCVSPNVKVGDHVRLPDGTIGSVVSLSGKSYRCQEPERPIRAEIAPP